MSHYLNQTSKAVLDKYKGDLNNLREQAEHDPAKERELIKEFKVQKQRPCNTTKRLHLIYTPSAWGCHILPSILRLQAARHTHPVTASHFYI